MYRVLRLAEAQMRRIEPFFPISRGLRRVDDRRVVSGIVYVIRNGLQWKDAPDGNGPHETLYNRFVRWSRLGVLDESVGVDTMRRQRRQNVTPSQWRQFEHARCCLSPDLDEGCPEYGGWPNSGAASYPDRQSVDRNRLQLLRQNARQGFQPKGGLVETVEVEDKVTGAVLPGHKRRRFEHPAPQGLLYDTTRRST